MYMYTYVPRSRRTRSVNEEATADGFDGTVVKGNFVAARVSAGKNKKLLFPAEVNVLLYSLDT